MQPVEKVYAKGTIGDLYQQVMILREQERAAASVVWTKDQIKRDDWPRAWRHLAPVVGDVKPHQVTTKIIFAIYTKVENKFSKPRRTESSRCGARSGSG